MADFLDWNYNSSTGQVMHLPSAESSVYRSLGMGWHGPFKTKEEALQFYADNKAANPGWKAPAGWQENITNILKAPGEIAGNAAADVWGKLNLGGWFIRIGEVLLGIVLIGVGIARLTGVQNAIAKVAKVAIPG